jgi:hypothetical protein
MEEIDQLAATVRHYENLGDIDSAVALAEKEPVKYAFRKETAKIRRKLAKIRKDMKWIEADVDMSSSEKRKMIDDLLVMRNEIVKDYYESMKDYIR